MNYLFYIFILISTCFGQFGNNQSMTKSGTTVAQFLKIGMDARSSGMGGAVTGQKANLTGIYWNPGGVAGQKGIGIQFGSYDWLVGMKYQFAILGINLGKNDVFGISIVNL